MDIDCPIVGLKRSSSAPMINEISATMSITSSSTSAPRYSIIFKYFGNVIILYEFFIILFVHIFALMLNQYYIIK